MDNTGNVRTYNGTTWSAAKNIDSGRALNAISCAAMSFCVTGDSTGSVVHYQPPASQLTWGSTSSRPTVASDGNYHYIYGPTATPVEQINLTSGTVNYLTFTLSDSSWLATDASGNQAGFWRYDAFGTLAYGTPVSAFGYSGEYADRVAGLSNLRARWYDPAIGSFTSRDPAFATTRTAYVYGNDDPVGRADPSGLDPSYLDDNKQSCEHGAWMQNGYENCPAGSLPLSGMVDNSVINYWNFLPGSLRNSVGVPKVLLTTIWGVYMRNPATAGTCGTLESCVESQILPGWDPAVDDTAQGILGLAQMDKNNDILWFDAQVTIAEDHLVFLNRLAEVMDLIENEEVLADPIINSASYDQSPQCPQATRTLSA